MKKIDVSTIEGYENMTAEEKLKILEAFEYEDNSDELERYKKAVTKANSEASEWKKKHNALLSEDEQKKNERDDEFNKILAELETMKKEKQISDHTARFIGLGYDEKLAKETAEAFVNGETDKVFTNHQKFIETHDKTLKAELMKGTPTPPAGKTGDEEMTLDKFRKLPATERYEYSQKNPEEYKKLYGGNE